ncbi:RND family efflux transporter, MFP subunit [Roseateles sp. YR242]|uniref:efflux RND transporter periplasmic adaptor subunit n=1 Tax=Roseateles sp. YR242 TaxID=1855305 RepID=UPI0008AE04BE|nr:efflux RND transporter periplasmic adaptor subunit [Roseateles sp. YR242]SEK20795.1 RND family efflux transporter, MFP subunit [Roseateles sp. YR242]
MSRLSLIALATLALLTACGKPAPDANGAKAGSDVKAVAATHAPSLILAPEDVQTLGVGEYASGPVVTGSIQPERRADLRAELQAVVLAVYKENGESVKRGDLLARLDDTAIRDSVQSADEAVRASSQSFEQAERQFQRLKTLQAQGMSSIQAMEDAEIRRNNAQSDLVAAKARQATARQQQQRTEIRAPFDGVVSDRKASPGDSAQLGKELIKVMDPGSMRFEGLVSADRMSELKLGQTVYFKVNGYPQVDFQGKVRRIAQAANANTRQVEVLVDFAGAQQPGVAGLYAEGRVQTTSVSALMVADGALVKEGDRSYVWRIDSGAINKIEVRLGARDDRQGLYVVAAGLKPNDRILRHPNSTLQNGQKVDFTRAPKPAPAASTPKPSTMTSSARDRMDRADGMDITSPTEAACAAATEDDADGAGMGAPARHSMFRAA